MTRSLPAGHCRPGRPHTRDVDEIVVVRLVQGTLATPQTSTEMALAIAELDRYRLSAREIACRIGCTTRTVHRHRAKRRKEAA